MKKLTIIFKDNHKVVYTMKNHIDHVQYFESHSVSRMKSAILQQYPKNSFKPVVLVGEVDDLCQEK